MNPKTNNRESKKTGIPDGRYDLTPEEVTRLDISDDDDDSAEIEELGLDDKGVDKAGDE